MYRDGRERNERQTPLLRERGKFSIGLWYKLVCGLSR